MVFSSWVQELKQILGRGNRASRRANRRSFVPRLESCEDRTMPSTFSVLNLNDSGTGSLRAAIASANTHVGADTIVFSPGLHGIITLTTGELLITDSVSISGSGASNLSVSGNNASRVFEINTGLNVSINNLTITHGSALDDGGGILNHGSNLTLSGDVLTLNVVTESANDACARRRT